MARYIDMPVVDSASADWAAYLEGLAPSELDEYEPEPLKADYPSGLDGHETGTPQIGDINGLSRTNYFNGRYLDAEALRRDQVYFARRDRLVAQTEHAGIAWGLGLEYPRLKSKKTRAPHAEEEGTPNGLATTSQIVLRPGVAFDGDGRPILVDRPFGFTLSELLTEYAHNPNRAVKPASRFQPCICVERVPGNESAGPEYPTGAYILVISPTAKTEGSARVYADPCAKDRNVHCDADALRHSFRLSLVRYSEFQPEAQYEYEQGEIDPCRIRGLMAAHYFDVWERNLGQRWRPEFARDHRFCDGLGPFHRVPGAVALAMTFVTSGGEVVVFDPWIPRRYQMSSASRAWEAAVRGAPTPTASVARRHQFQCQLTECIDRKGFRNLYQLGIRHMAPSGFLPLDTQMLRRDEQMLRKRPEAHEARRIRSVMKIAQRYFDGTNVLPRYRVALYEDDIFEELKNAAEKDPLIVRPAEANLWYCIENFFLSGGISLARGSDLLSRQLTQRAANGEHSADVGLEEAEDHEQPQNTSLSKLMCCLAAGDAHTLEMVINREWSLVDVIIPMWGRRRHGREIQLSPELEEFRKTFGATTEEVDDYVGDSIAARDWVFFVKRKLVLDAWIYMVLDAIFDFLLFLRVIIRAASDKLDNPADCIFKPSHESGSPDDGQYKEVTKTTELAAKRPKSLPRIDNDETAMVMSTALRRTRPELRSRKVLDEFDTLSAKFAVEYMTDNTKEEAARLGRYDAIDVMLEEYPGFGDYKALTLLDPNLAESVHASLRADAKGSAPAAAEVFPPSDVAGLKGKKSAIYIAARSEFGKATVAVGDVNVSRNELLHTSPEDLESKYAEAAEASKKVAKDGRQLKRAALRLAEASSAGPKLATAYENAVVEHGEEAALAHLEKERGFKNVAADLRAIKEVVGSKGLDRIMLTMRNQ